MCTESGLRCRFLSGEANLGRLGNNLVTAVGGCWGGGVVGQGFDRFAAVRTRLTLHSFPVNAAGLQEFNPLSAWAWSWPESLHVTKDLHCTLRTSLTTKCWQTNLWKIINISLYLVKVT